MPFGLEIIAVIYCIFLFAALVHGSIGFGFPLLSTPLLALIMDIQSAIILTLIPNILINLISIGSEGNVWQAFRRYFPLALLAMLGSALGTYILILTNNELFKALLAAAIILYLFANKIRLNFNWIRRYPELAKISFGLTAGLLGGLTNVMAPILIIYSLETRQSKGELIQLSNFCFMLGKSIQLLLFALYGKFTLSDLSQAPWMMAIVVLALYAGIHIRKKIHADAYIKVMQAFLAILAGVLLLQVIF